MSELRQSPGIPELPGNLPSSPNAELKGVPRAVRASGDNLSDDLLRLRAVLIFLAAPRGAKRQTAAALSRDLGRFGLKAGVRSIYRWRNRYLCDGFAGLARRRRSDYGCLHFDEETLVSIIDYAARVRRSGDLRREYGRLRPPISYETFRTWVRRLQGGFRFYQKAW
jgi:hypothetical protein